MGYLGTQQGRAPRPAGGWLVRDTAPPPQGHGACVVGEVSGGKVCAAVPGVPWEVAGGARVSLGESGAWVWPTLILVCRPIPSLGLSGLLGQGGHWVLLSFRPLELSHIHAVFDLPRMLFWNSFYI